MLRIQRDVLVVHCILGEGEIYAHTEGVGVHHVHFHIVPRLADLPAHLKGPRVFALLAVDDEHAIGAQALTTFCEEFTRKLMAIQ